MSSGDDVALVHNRHAVAELLRLVHEVRDEDDGGPLADLLDGSHAIRRPAGSSPAVILSRKTTSGGLTTPRDDQALALPAGKGGGGGFPLLRQAPLLEQGRQPIARGETGEQVHASQTLS